MKTSSLVAILAGALVLFSACSTLTEPQQQTLGSVAVVLRSSARSTALLAISKDPSNRELVQLSVTALDQLILNTNFSSTELQAALAPVWQHSKDPVVTLALAGSLDLYDLFLGEWAKGQVNSNEVARTLLTALRTGGQQALSGFPAPPK